MRLFSCWAVWVGLVFIGAGTRAEQPASKQHQATKLCEHLLVSSLTPDSFEGNPLFTESAPGVFQIIGSEIYESEINTLSLLIQRFGGRALAIGNFGHMKGLPAVDAVYFPKSGEPVNLSIKTILLSNSTNGIRGFRKHANEAESSIEKHLSREAYAHALGLEVDEQGLYAAPGTNHRQYRMRTAEALFRILGLDQDRPRRAGILMDVSVESRQRPTLIHVDRDDPEHERLRGDVLLRIVDERVDEDSIEFPAVMNLSQMIRRMHEGGSVRKFIALFAGASVVVDSAGLKYHLH